MNVLVTGGAGYVGSLLSYHLMLDHHISIIDNGVFGYNGVPVEATLYQEDITNFNSSILDRIEAIIHLAGISTDPTAQVNPRTTDLVNHIATVRLAQLAKEKGIKKFIFASSASVYFNYDVPQNPPLSKESDLVNPMSAYALSKRAAEIGLMELSDKDFFPIILRCGTIYGVSPRMRLDLVLNSFVKTAIDKNIVMVNCNGLIYRPMIDIRDMIRTYKWFLEVPNDVLHSNIFNINSYNYNLMDLANEVSKITGAKIITNSSGVVRNYLSDNSIFSYISNGEFIPMYKSIIDLHHFICEMPDLDNIRYYNDRIYAQR
jgi:nucleoside-diphosphate-sugar epimerase